MMSTYSDEVPAVAMSSRIGTSRVTVWPSEFVPVARIVRGYSPAASEPPPRLRLTDWVVPLLRVNVLGVTDRVPMPEGSTPASPAPPSIVSVTGPANAVLFELGVEKFIVPVAVAPVVAIANTCPEPVLEKSRATPPMLTATG